MRYKKHTNKKAPVVFGPQHFPIGTVFRCDDWSHLADGNPFTCHGITQNGHDSYVISTGRKSSIEGIDEALNIHHVTSLIKRGTGPVVIDYGWYGMPKAKDIAKDMDLDQITDQGYGRNFYVSYGLRPPVMYEVSKFAHPSTMLDWERLTDAVSKQFWCRQQNLMQGLLWYFVIDKKRLRKFLRTNLNRFRTNVAKAAAAYEAEMEKIFEEDWDADFDQRMRELEVDSANEKKPADEGSHYDHNDPAYERPPV